MRVPPLETDRLLIRPFTMDDCDEIHRILDVELASAEFGTEGALSLDARRRWLQWSVLSYEELAQLNQPPYGDRAIALRQTGRLIGACGFAPCLAPFGQLAAMHSGDVAQGGGDGVAPGYYSSEIGLYWAIDPAYQRQGYAGEAARALIDVAFRLLNLRRIVATTTYDNAASIGVMRKVGMRIERNPYADPPWFQIAGILDHP